MDKFNKYRAKIEILNYIVSVCTNTFTEDYGKHVNIPKKENGFISSLFNRSEIPLNTLVKLNCVRESTEYYLGWLREIKDDGVFLIESIENGKLCNWSNVGIEYMPVESIQSHWIWNDKQFDIKDKWMRACYKSRDCHLLRPLYPEFSQEDNSFTLSLRVMFSDDVVATKKFNDYKKVLVRDMLNFYDEALYDYQFKNTKKKK